MREQLIDQGNQLEELLADDFVYIRQDGEQMDKEAYKAEKDLNSAIKDIQITSISQKTKLICYELDGIVHTSIWRRHETWQNIFHQETKKRIEKSCHETGFFYSSSYQIHLDTHNVRIFQGVLRSSHLALFGE